MVVILLPSNCKIQFKPVVFKNPGQCRTKFVNLGQILLQKKKRNPRWQSSTVLDKPGLTDTVYNSHMCWIKKIFKNY